LRGHSFFRQTFIVFSPPYGSGTVSGSTLRMHTLPQQ
jgi:hypothetical protein